MWNNLFHNVPITPINFPSASLYFQIMSLYSMAYILIQLSGNEQQEKKKKMGKNNHLSVKVDSYVMRKLGGGIPGVVLRCIRMTAWFVGFGRKTPNKLPAFVRLEHKMGFFNCGFFEICDDYWNIAKKMYHIISESSCFEVFFGILFFPFWFWISEMFR